MKIRQKIILVLVIMLIPIMCTLTYSYYIDKDKAVNIANGSDSKIEIIEKFPKPPDPIYPPQYEQQKEVSIKNLKDKSYVRCFLEISDESVRSKVHLTYSSDTNWVKDGEYWYYKLPLDTGETTPPLLESVHFLYNVPKDMFDIIVYAESVQAEGYKDYKEAFEALN